MLDIQNNDLVYFLERDEMPFPASMLAGGFSDLKNTQDYYGIDGAVMLLSHEKYFFMVKSQADYFVEQLKEKIKEKNYLKNIKEANIKAGHDLLAYAEKFNTSFENFDNKKLADWLDEYFQKNKRYSGYYTIALFQKPLTDLARDLSQKYPGINFSPDKIFDLITTPSELTSSEQEVDNFLRLCSDFQMGRSISQAVEDHVVKYNWLPLRYFKGDKWTKEDIMERVKNYSGDAESELKSRLEARENHQKELEQLFVIFNEEDSILADQIRDIVYLRTKRAEFVDESSAKLLDFLEEIARRLNVTRSDMIYAFHYEIAAALRGENIDLVKIIKQRKKDYIVICPPEDNAYALVGKDLDKFLEQHKILQVDATGDRKLIKGTIAYTGKVRGRAKIVKTTKDLSKVRKGDILVAVMTFPNFIVAMERAAAFVTDEGGILCHAAIVSREMKKPCVIGTKIATQVFVDDDMVEVNADKGIIRKI